MNLCIENRIKHKTFLLVIANLNVNMFDLKCRLCKLKECLVNIFAFTLPCPLFLSVSIAVYGQFALVSKYHPVKVI